MELYQLRYFVAVAEEQNVTAAARLLNVSQPPVTRAIQSLERKVGHKLLVRSTKGVSLTAAGREFLAEARKTLAQVQRMVDRSSAAGRGERGQLQIGFFGSSIYAYLPAVLRRFREEVPDVEIVFHAMSKSEQVEALRAHRLDVGFARYYGGEPDMTIETVSDEQLMAAFPASAPEASLVEAKPKALSDAALILFPQGGRPNFADEILRFLGNAGIAPRVTQIADDVTSAMGLVASGIGATIVPESIAALTWPHVAFCPIRGANTRIPVNMIYCTDEVRPATRAFINLVHAMAEVPVARVE
ncbi:LysR family transcriptional regulator [Sphingopyxis indica]|uniref:LysR family transcriptional regulator n=1 Tax=Sphingopyxis indica TaxID=436663 RepID=UPI0029393C0E|nr:LysR family transcriptional regulator [Sphingopyxis indica]